MNRLSDEKRIQILASLVEGNSIRGTARIVGCSVNTVMKLFTEVGRACEFYMHKHLTDLPCTNIQVDEIWSFCYAKQKNKKDYMGKWVGDIWTWIAICADTKLVPSFHVGARDRYHAVAFARDLAGRCKERLQLTSDGYKPYTQAIEAAFAGKVDYAQLVKEYGTVEGDNRLQYIGSSKETVCGNPDQDKVSTSYVERQNLTMRMGMRRFTRGTNGFSKKIENHRLAIALHFFYYNYIRIHQSLRVTPAMEAGITDHVWELEDMLHLADEATLNLAFEGALP